MCRSIKTFWRCGCYKTTYLVRCPNEFDKNHKISQEEQTSLTECKSHDRGHHGISRWPRASSRASQQKQSVFAFWFLISNTSAFNFPVFKILDFWISLLQKSICPQILAFKIFLIFPPTPPDSWIVPHFFLELRDFSTKTTPHKNIWY